MFFFDYEIKIQIRSDFLGNQIIIDFNSIWLCMKQGIISKKNP